MNSTDYYKSLISDEEVIRALMKESKARQELFKERTRMRPNLKFFQRTVTNLVTSNKRISTTKELIYKEKEERVGKIKRKIKTPQTLIREILTTNKIEFVPPCNEKNAIVETSSSSSSSSLSQVEKTCKEDTSKYFVRSVHGNSSNKPINNRKFTFNNRTKPKNIVFNLNFNKDGPLKTELSSETVSKSEKQSTSQATTHNITSSQSDVIQISDTESD